MTPPNKCGAVRRASIHCADLKELDELSSEATILLKRFDDIRWQWTIVVEHDILPLVAPGHENVAYQSVKTFNRMIEQSIAKAIAGVSAEQDDPQAAALRTLSQQLGQYQQLPLQHSFTGGSLYGRLTSTSDAGLFNPGQAPIPGT